MQRQHDMGGDAAAGIKTGIDTAAHPVAAWQKETWAMRVALGADRLKLIRVDELRRAIEDLAPEDYDRAYFERWILALRNLLVEKGVLSRDEIDARIADLRRRRPEKE